MNIHLTTLLAALALAACSDDTNATSSSSGGSSSGSVGTDAGVTPEDAAPAKKDIVDTAVGAGQFTVLADLLTRADLVSTLKGTGPFTVLAPTDAAFGKLPAATVEALKDPKNKALLAKILTYHVIGANAPASVVTSLNGKAAASVEGENLNIAVEGGKVVVNKGPNQSTVTATDVMATNGVIHVVDTVILPPTYLATKDIVDTAVDNGGFTTLASLLTDTGLVPTLKGDGPFTVFAPTDAAFAAISGTLAGLTTEQKKDVLLYHVAPQMAGSVKVTSSTTLDTALTGKKLPVKGTMLNDNANITMTDIACKNGIIHVIDAVMVPK